MRWRVLQTGRVYIKQHPGDAQLSLDELRDMVGREGQTFSNRVSTVSESTKTVHSIRVPKLSTVSESTKTVHSIREYQNFPNSYLLFTKVSMHLSISHSLCSAVHNCDSLCRRSSRSPIMLSILLVLLGEREQAHLVVQLRLFFYISVRTSCPKSSTCFVFSDISIFLRRK